MSKRKSVNVISEETIKTIDRACNQILNLTVGTGLKWTPSDKNAVLELTEDAIGGGVPEGYVETTVILCQSGSPVTGTILFKETV